MTEDAGRRPRAVLVPVAMMILACACLFAAAAYMRLADATAIGFLNPIVAMVLAIPILGETVGRWRWGAAFVAFIGAVVLVRPGTDAFQPAALLALLAALLVGLEVVLVKRLTNIETPLRILAIGNMIGGVLAVGAASFVWIWPTPMQWMLLAGIGFAMVAAQALLLQALKRGDASFVIPLFYSALVFAGLYDYAVFGERPGINTVIGAMMIIGGSLVIAWRERSRG